MAMEVWQALAQALPGQVELGEEKRAEVAGDLSPVEQMRALQGSRPALPGAVVRPGSAADVQAALRFAHEHGLGVVARGGGSGVVGGIAPGGQDIVLDLRGIAAIGPIEAESGLVTAGAGCGLQDLEAELAAEGLTVGHYPQSIALATLGGLVATRSSGQYSTRYGDIEDMIAGLEVVLADGTLAQLGRAPRRALGPELWPLFVGAEGTLGVVTSVTLAAWPVPRREELRCYAFAGFAAGLAAMRDLVRAGLPLGVIRLYDQGDAMYGFGDLLPDGGVAALLLLSCLGEAEVATGGAAAADRIAGALGAQPLPAAVAEHWRLTRNDVAEWGTYLAQGVLVDTVECAATWRDLPRAYEAALGAVRAVPELVAAFGHAAHGEASGAALYFTLAAVPLPEGDPAELQRRIWDALLSAAAAAGASVGHHHRVGRMRREWAWRERREEIPLVDQLRASLDPGRVLNSGALWPD